MQQLYGVTNHNPFFVLNCLRKYKGTLGKDKRFKVQTLEFGGKPKKKVDVILVPTVHMFIKHREFLNKCKSIVFVFDNPVLCEYLTPIELIDVGSKPATYRYVFKRLEYSDVVNLLNLPPKDLKVTSKVIQVIPTLLNEVKSSILNPLLNYFYTMKDTDMRLKIQRLIFIWMVSDKPTDALKKKIVKTTGRNSKPLDKLCEQLDSDIGVKTRKSIRDLVNSKEKENKTDYAAVEKRYGVASFDLKYLMSVVRKSNSYEEPNVTTDELGSGTRRT